MIFPTRFIFSEGGDRSREYISAARCIRDGLNTIAAKHTVYEIVRADEEPSRPRGLNETTARLKSILLKQQLGVTTTVRALDDLTLMKVGRVNFRVVTSLPAPANVQGTLKTREWVALLEADPEWTPRFAGTVACKPNSDHAFGAACDDFDTPKNMAAQQDFAIQNAEKLGVKYVILFDDIWTYGPPRTESSRGWRPYMGVYHHHLHVSFDDGKCGVYCTPGYGGCK